MSRGSAVDAYVCWPRRIWHDLKSAGVSLAPSSAALYAWLGTGSLVLRIPGVVAAGPLTIAEAIDWPAETVVTLLAELERCEVVLVDRVARIVYLPAVLKAECSRPTSPSTASMWKREILTLPDCQLRTRITEDARAIVASLNSDVQIAAFDTGRDPQKGKPKRPRASSLSGGDLADNLTGCEAGNLSGDHRARDLALSLAPSQAPDLEPAREQNGTARPRVEGLHTLAQREKEAEGAFAALHERARAVSKLWHSIPGALPLPNAVALMPIAEALDGARELQPAATPPDAEVLVAMCRIAKKRQADGLHDVFRPKTLAGTITLAIQVARGEVDLDKPRQQNDAGVKGRPPLQTHVDSGDVTRKL